MMTLILLITQMDTIALQDSNDTELSLNKNATMYT